MKDHDSQETLPRLDSERQPYEPPDANFLPLKLEERLMACRVVRDTCGNRQDICYS